MGATQLSSKASASQLSQKAKLNLSLALLSHSTLIQYSIYSVFAFTGTLADD
jgi:hypothetical protein